MSGKAKRLHLVLAKALKMLADRNGLLDEAVQILWDFSSQALHLEDAQDFRTGDALHLGNTEEITKDDTDLGWGVALLCQLADLLSDFGHILLAPGGCAGAVGERAAGYTLAIRVHAAHGGSVFGEKRTDGEPRVDWMVWRCGF